MLIDSLKACIPLVKQVWLADDATAAGEIKQLKAWYDKLIKDGQKMGYYVNRSKSWLIVKNEESEPSRGATVLYFIVGRYPDGI